MAKKRVLTRIVRPLAKGQITIPAPFRRELGIDESTPLRVTLLPDRLEVARIREAQKPPLREYTRAQIKRFLQEDRLDRETADKIRRLLAEGKV